MIYYLRNDKKEIVATVVLTKSEEGNWSRGISVRSKKDRPTRKLGMAIATERSLHAIDLFRRSNVVFSPSVYLSLMKRICSNDLLKLPKDQLAFKSYPKAELSQFERRVLKRYHKENV